MAEEITSVVFLRLLRILEGVDLISNRFMQDVVFHWKTKINNP